MSRRAKRRQERREATRTERCPVRGDTHFREWFEELPDEIWREVLICGLAALFRIRLIETTATYCVYCDYRLSSRPTEV